MADQVCIQEFGEGGWVGRGTVKDTNHGRRCREYAKIFMHFVLRSG